MPTDPRLAVSSFSLREQLGPIRLEFRDASGTPQVFTHDSPKLFPISDFPPPSTRFSPNCFFNSSSYCGASAMARFSASPNGSTSEYQPSIVTRPSSSFIDARRRASSIAGLGDQFP